MRVDFDTIQPEKTLTGAVKGVTVEQIQQLKKVAMTGAAAKQADAVELKKKNAALEKENAEMRRKSPLPWIGYWRRKIWSFLKPETSISGRANQELKEALEEERLFQIRLLEGIDRVLDMLERHLPKAASSPRR